MSADDRGPRNNLVQEIFWTRTGLLLLALLLVSGSCLGGASFLTGGALRSLLVSVGTGTLITAVVGFGQTLITATASQRALVTPLVAESRRALQELSAEYRKLNGAFYPTDIFEPTRTPSPGFNRLMMDDLHRTREYLFRGFSGRHAAARLLRAHQEKELRVALADPADQGAVGGRARYLLRGQNDGDDGLDYDALCDQLRDEIHIGLVGLYLARSRCSRVDVTVVADPPLDRMEMFDDSVWVTLFSDPTGATMRYPRTLRFSEGSYIYSMLRAEFLRICSSRAAHHYLITPDTTVEEFRTLFHTITGTKLSEHGFRALESKFHRFAVEFSTSAELGG